VWDATNGVVADPAKVHAINHTGRFFKLKGPLSVPPSPPKAGGSPRGIRAAAKFVDLVFGAGKGTKLMTEQRAHMDAALQAEAVRLKERLIADVPTEAIGVWLSHSAGFDMSTLTPRFSLREPNRRIFAANASPVGFVGRLSSPSCPCGAWRRGLLDPADATDEPKYNEDKQNQAKDTTQPSAAVATVCVVAAATAE
jgi:alkanesulfonate monooxygenase SsuD/methylene tetrahydromethanopterin reductase-like flavin-dependent oxidoreductase (luciferase family)